MARRKGRILPFRIPFFRIFYSTTYTTLFLLCLGLLAITPATLLYAAIENDAFQYVFMIGGVYILTAPLAVFIYSSRLYTNRTILAAVGKAYLPVEDGEVGKSVRKMIVNQLERSAIVAWESRPRDLEGEILLAEKAGILAPETQSLRDEGYTTTVGELIAVDSAEPPWGHVQHPGWSSPSHREHGVGADLPSTQFDVVLSELPNLIEARVVVLAPADPLATPKNGQAVADAAVVDALKRPKTMGMRDYLTQLSYLGLVNPPEVGSSFLLQYENARFCAKPISQAEFQGVMTAFTELYAGVTKLDSATIAEIHAQSARSDTGDLEEAETAPSETGSTLGSTIASPVTARTRPSRTTTPYLQQRQAASNTSLGADSMSSVIHSRTPSPYVLLPYATQSVDTFSSVIRRTPDELMRAEIPRENASFGSSSSSLQSPSLRTLPSDAGSVVRRSVSPEYG